VFSFFRLQIYVIKIIKRRLEMSETKSNIKFNGVLGIDLGTTNTCFAYMKGGEPEVVTNRKGARTTMSVVYYPSSGIPTVGEEADSQSLIYPEAVVYASKRIMGLMFDDPKVKQSIKHVRYKIVAKNDKAAIELEKKNDSGAISREVVYPEQVAAEILSEAKLSFAHTYGCDPSDKIDAVITVPAYFTDPQKQATIEAGKIAGLNVKRIINEPTAAALAYVYKEKINKSQTIAVYDLGGGTFDISIVQIDPPSKDEQEYVVQVLATAGDAFLGGEDFDEELYKRLTKDIKHKYPDVEESILSNPSAQQRLRDAAQKAKKILSTAQSTKIQLPFLYADSRRTVNYDFEIMRSEFEAITKHIIAKTKAPCLSALEDAKVSKVDEVLLVGGMTRMPAVSDFVESIFHKKPTSNINPDEAVALGAAIQGGIIKGDIKDIVLLDVAPLSLGIETLGGVCTVLIPRNTTIPAKRSQIFSTAVDNQSEVFLNILQGERYMAKDNKSLGSFKLEGIAPAPRGMPQIEVTFDINVNGILEVSAKDKNTNKEQSITIQGSGQLSPEELERLVKEAERNKEIDKQRMEFVNLTNETDSRIREAEKGLETWKEAKFEHEKIEEIAKMKDDLQKDLTELREEAARVDGAENLSQSSIENLREASKNLSELMMKVGEEFYKKKDNSTSNADDQSTTHGSDSESSDSDSEM
jgi:molecular chaperone DnaK